MRFLFLLCAVIGCFAAQAYAQTINKSPLQFASSILKDSDIVATIVINPVDMRHINRPYKQELILSRSDGSRIAKDFSHSNSAINLYRTVSGLYVFRGREDCILFDTEEFRTRSCNQEDTKILKPQYIGRYDWMNSFDNGVFTFGFRYENSSKAAEQVWLQK